jgi:hypothetical protein
MPPLANERPLPEELPAFSYFKLREVENTLCPACFSGWSTFLVIQRSLLTDCLLYAASCTKAKRKDVV